MYANVVWSFGDGAPMKVLAEAPSGGARTVSLTLGRDASEVRLFLTEGQTARIIAELSVALRELDRLETVLDTVIYRRPCCRCQEPVDQAIVWDGKPICQACLEVQTALASDDSIQEKEGV